MSDTIIVASGLSENTETIPVQIFSGQYLIALNGDFGGGTVQSWVRIGPDVVAPITDSAYTEAGAEVIWLPNCTFYVELSGATSPDVNVSLARLSV